MSLVNWADHVSKISTQSYMYSVHVFPLSNFNMFPHEQCMRRHWQSQPLRLRSQVFCNQDFSNQAQNLSHICSSLVISMKIFQIKSMAFISKLHNFDHRRNCGIIIVINNKWLCITKSVVLISC